MLTTFRLYQTETSKFTSTFFDLIEGDMETKQTKGLAYLFNLSPEFLKRFLSIDKINNGIKRSLKSDEYREFLKSDVLKIDAEMMSEGKEKVRRDITLTFYYKSKKVFIIIIEAKNIKLGKNHKMESQLQTYINSNYFPHDEHVAKMVIALTKYEQYFTEASFVSITWIELIQALHQTLQGKIELTKSIILRDYYKFITGVDKNMHFYEKEILSVSAAKTYKEITKYHIHACPVSYNYRDSLFIAFRQKGGVMDKLYKIDEILEFDPRNDSMVEIVADRVGPFKERLLSYLEDRKKKYGFNHDGAYRFYILSEKKHIALPHHPHPEKNNTGPRYYTLAELLSGREIVYTGN